MNLPIENLRKLSGIYCAIHRDSGMCYVGSTANMAKRRGEHLYDAFNGGRSCFHRALREFGEAAFDFEVLERCPKETLLERERFWIVLLDAASAESGFNTRENPAAPYTGELSAVTRRRMSLVRRGVRKSPQAAARIKASKQGYKPSASASVAGGKSHKGKRRSAESIGRMRVAARARVEKMRLATIGSEPHQN